MRTTRRVACEQGAILIQVAISSLVLVAFAAFVIDNGILWVSRSQAQNAADAGAMAAALARAYNDVDAIATGKQVVATNLIWLQPGSADVAYGNCFPGTAGECVYVTVFRNGEGDPVSPRLPTVFGPLLGIADQGVKAYATAVVTAGNATHCLRPIAIPDKWTEGSMPADTSFLAYVEGVGTPAPNPDVYVAPSDTDPGTGYTYGIDLGLDMTLRFSTPAGSPPIVKDDFVPLDLTPGGATYQQNITMCNRQLLGLGTFQPISTDAATTDVNTADAFTDLFDADPSATWDDGLNRIADSCAPTCAPVSPRLVPIAVYDVDTYQHMRALGDWTGCPGGAPCVRMVNIIGFFITGFSGLQIQGHLTSYPGLVSQGFSKIQPNASFLKSVSLIR